MGYILLLNGFVFSGDFFLSYLWISLFRIFFFCTMVNHHLNFDFGNFCQASNKQMPGISSWIYIFAGAHPMDAVGSGFAPGIWIWWNISKDSRNPSITHFVTGFLAGRSKFQGVPTISHMKDYPTLSLRFVLLAIVYFLHPWGIHHHIWEICLELFPSIKQANPR